MFFRPCHFCGNWYCYIVVMFLLLWTLLFIWWNIWTRMIYNIWVLGIQKQEQQQHSARWMISFHSRRSYFLLLLLSVFLRLRLLLFSSLSRLWRLSAVACRYGFYWFLVSLLMNTFWCYGIWILFAYWCNNHMCLPLWDEQSIDRNICLYVKPPPQQRYIIILLTFICACVCVKLSIDNLIE